MLTECRPDLFGFAPVEGREVVRDPKYPLADQGRDLAAATRNPRGITPSPTESPSRLSQPDIVQAPLASADATADHAAKNQQASPQICPIMQS